MADPAVAWPGRPRPADVVAEADDLVVRRDGHVILDHLTFTIGRGRVTGLLGPSGCGKTTLMRTLVGVQTITAGQAELLGLPVGDPRLRHRIGYSTQEPAIYSDLTLAENLRYFGTVLGLRRSHLADAIARTVASLDLGGLEGRLVGTFSGGQRVAAGVGSRDGRGRPVRLLAMPLGRLGLLAGYAIAFGMVACAQVGVVLASR